MDNSDLKYSSHAKQTHTKAKAISAGLTWIHKQINRDISAQDQGSDTG